MRVLRSFAFVDLSGFTAFTDLHGDEVSGGVLAEFRAAVRDVSSRRGVRVAKWLGDGAMFVAVEASPLVAAVLEMEEKVDATSPLCLRAGLTEGRVILFEGDDYIGSHVNLAARLCDLAPPNQVLATPELQSALPPWAAAEPFGPVVVRGFGRPVPVVRLSRRDHGGGVVDPVCRMELPVDGVVVRRTGADGDLVPFCSDSCADAWDEANRGLAAAP